MAGKEKKEKYDAPGMEMFHLPATDVIITSGLEGEDVGLGDIVNGTMRSYDDGMFR